MIGGFTFNGRSISDFDLVSRSVTRPLLPEGKVGRVEFSNASGAYDTKGIEYGLRLITMRIMYIGKDYYELRTRAHEIAAWLSTDDYKQLVMDDEPLMPDGLQPYYMARVTSQLDLAHFWKSGAIDVIFDCQPFLYTADLQNYVALPLNGAYAYQGTRILNYKSPPFARFEVMASVQRNVAATIRINNTYIGYTPSQNGTIIIDSVNMLIMFVYSGGAQNIFGQVQGDVDQMFTFTPGSNNIVTSGVTSLTTQYTTLWY